MKARWKGHGLNKSSDGLYTHHVRLVIPRLAQDLCIALLIDCRVMIVHQIGNNACWQLCANLRFLRERLYLVGLECSFLQIIMFAIIEIRYGKFFCLVSLCVTAYSWEIVGMDCVTELTTSSEFHLTTILDFVCHLIWRTFFCVRRSHR